MKRKIRYGVFETNSSSSHSLTMCSAEEFKKWQNGEMLFDEWNENFVPAIPLSDDEKRDVENAYEGGKPWHALSDEEKNAEYIDYARANGLVDEDYRTYEEYMSDDELDSYEQSYTTEGGEEIVAFGKYGYC